MTTCGMSWKPSTLEGGGKAIMSSSLEPHTEILGNRQTTWTAYASLYTCTHWVTSCTRVQHSCHTTYICACHGHPPSTSRCLTRCTARHHGASGPRWHARIAPRGFDPKYNLLFPLPGQEGDKSKLYFWGCGNPFLHLSVNLERQSAPTEPR